jgi:molybdate transport system substrate-binding protein
MAASNTARRRRLLGAIVGLAASAWLLPTGASWAQPRGVVVFAAASLKNALDDIKTQYERDTGKRVAISYAASPTLAKQIEAAAPADIFICADLDWMDYLAERKLITPGSRVNLLGNSITLIAPTNSTASTAIAPNFPLASLLGNGRLAMADPNSVPAGKYGKAALESSACGLP